MNIASPSKTNIFNNAYKANWVGNNVVCLCSTTRCKTFVASKGKDCPRLAFEGMPHCTLTQPMLMFSWCLKCFFTFVMDVCLYYSIISIFSHHVLQWQHWPFGGEFNFFIFVAMPNLETTKQQINVHQVSRYQWPYANDTNIPLISTWTLIPKLPLQ